MHQTSPITQLNKTSSFGGNNGGNNGNNGSRMAMGGMRRGF